MLYYICKTKKSTLDSKKKAPLNNLYEILREAFLYANWLLNSWV